MPTFPFTEVKSVARWSNYSGTIQQAVPVFCTPDVFGETGDAVPRKLKRNGDALRAILEYCFATPGTTLRATGARWSFSNVIKPGNLIVDPANLNQMYQVKKQWLNPTYRDAKPNRTPMFVQGGAHISSINRRLLQRSLALQTTGAGDGHRIAGCIATGTHGSALDIGALHDTVLGFHLITGPSQSVFLQPNEPACGPEVAHWLRKQTGLFVRDVNDSELFAAAQVSLGSLGFVHGVVLETVPIYGLRGLVVNRPFTDTDVWNTIDDLNTRRFHPETAERPYHFEIVLHPYPTQGGNGAFVKMYWKVAGDEAPHESPGPQAPDLSSDTMGLIAKLSAAIDGSLPTLAIRTLISDQLDSRYKPGPRAPQVPGMIFGPTGLPPGTGASTEVVVAQPKARQALSLLYEILAAEAAKDNHLLGAVAVRFVPKTSALLGMNIHEMNCFIELPSIRNEEVLGIYRLWWDALTKAGILFTYHWGQHHGMNPGQLKAYFGDRVERWRAARDRLVSGPEGRRVFSCPLLAEVGLD